MDFCHPNVEDYKTFNFDNVNFVIIGLIRASYTAEFKRHYPEKGKKIERQSVLGVVKYYLSRVMFHLV